MGAYSVPIRTKCDHQGCINKAVEKVYDHRNHERGQYCKKHAYEKVKALDEAGFIPDRYA